ncbi:MAG: hypothetical protein JO251_14345 [Verrucomicrobia bacterium]|nr:hypothetical protein [Verrucomicrobiota bacterium]
MTSTGASKTRSAMLLALVLSALSGGEMFWLYSQHRANEALHLSNIRQASQNWLDQRKITDLKAATVQINALYLRLGDPIVATQNLEQLPSLDHSGARKNGPEPVVIQDFVKSGFAAVSGARRRHESSVVFELASNQLEFHRVVPLLAQEENSNVFLFIDHIELLRPKTTEAFSEHPTALQSRLRVRMFTSGAQ